MSSKLLFLSLLIVISCANALMAQVHPLQQVLDRVRDEVAKGRKPIVVFDLDDTLFRVAYRTRTILRHWAARHPELPDLPARIDALDPLKMPWSLPATLDMLGLKDEKLRKEANKYWGDGFFSSRYLDVDETIRGGVTYANRLAREGARLIYLTGRDAERMGEGTLRSLIRSGFPAPEAGCHTLMMKPNWKMKDYVYKEQACRSIVAVGPVVASIDNEPKNCNIFQRLFPGALIVCIDTPHSDNAPALNPGIPVVPDYRF